jgi:transposase
MARPKKYPPELIERGIRLALESERPIAQIAHDLGIHPGTLRKKVRQHEADSGKRPDVPTSQEREEIRRLRQENFELRRANEILKSASVFFTKELGPGDTAESGVIDPPPYAARAAPPPGLTEPALENDTERGE